MHTLPASRLSSRTRPVQISLMISLLLIGRASSAVGDDAPTCVVISHVTTKAGVVDGRGSSSQVAKALENDGEISVRTSTPIVVVVSDTNTALFDFSTSAAKFDAPELVAIKAFFAQLGPYFVDAVGGAAPVGRASLARLRAAMSNLRRVEFLTLDTLEQMRGKGSVAPVAPEVAAGELLQRVSDFVAEAAQAPVPARVGCTSTCGVIKSYRLKAVPELIEGIDGLSKELGDVSRELKQKTVSRRSKAAALEAAASADKPAIRVDIDQLDDEIALLTTDAKEGEAFLAKADDYIGAAYALEALTSRVLNARSRWCSSEKKVSLSEGVKVSVASKAAKASDLARLADLNDVAFSFKARPDWFIRPALGLSLISARGATFPDYTTKADGGAFRIVESGSQDRRVGYAAVLGATWRGLDRRQTSGFAIWVPELFITPTGDRAVGIGAGVSLRAFRLSAGATWARHKVLAKGLTTNQLISTKEELTFDQSYRHPKFYVSLSIIGWAPFVAKD